MNKTINILGLHLRIGGVEVCLINLANAFVKRGYEVNLFCALKNNEFKDNAFDDRVKVYCLSSLRADDVSFNPNIFYRLIRKFVINRVYKKQIKRFNNEIVISSRNEFSILLSKYGNKSILKIAQLHNDYKGFNIENDFRYKYSNINYFVQLTDELRDEITSIMGPYNKFTKVITIPNFLKECKESYNPLSVEKRKPIAIAVGRLSHEKGFLRLIDIWNELLKIKNKDEKYVLEIIGEGIELPEIEKKILNFGLSDSIKLLGAKDNDFVIKAMRESRAYCMVSYSESFSLVLIEAMQAGVPQIAYDVRVGPRNLIINEKTGFLIKDNDYKEFAKILLRLLRCNKICNELSENSMMRAKEFSENNVMEKWLNIIE